LIFLSVKNIAINKAGAQTFEGMKNIC